MAVALTVTIIAIHMQLATLIFIFHRIVYQPSHYASIIIRQILLGAEDKALKYYYYACMIVYMFSEVYILHRIEILY